MKSISANDLTRTILCDQPGCPLDAEISATRCREHLRTPKTVYTARPGTFTRQQIIDAITRWAHEHDGVPPRSSDWHRAGSYWPNMTTAVRVFGKWGDALTAAGFNRNFHVNHRQHTALKEEATVGDPSATNTERPPGDPVASSSSAATVSEREPYAEQAQGIPRVAPEHSASASAAHAARTSSRSETAAAPAPPADPRSCVRDTFTAMRHEIDRLERELLDEIYRDAA